MKSLTALLLIVLAVSILSVPNASLLPLHAENAYAQNPPEKQGPQRKSRPAPTEDPDRPKGQTAIAVAVDLVSLQVLVTDPKGNVITGLRPEHFTVYEDNVKQEISHFTPVDANITVVMLVEYSKQV